MKFVIIFKGFLSTKTRNGRGNYGLFDQRMALKFVYDNIREFNGDPENITVIGHEAGAASIGLHLLTQNSPRKFINRHVPWRS